MTENTHSEQQTIAEYLETNPSTSWGVIRSTWEARPALGCSEIEYVNPEKNECLHVLVHPTARIADDVEMEFFSEVREGAVVEAGVRLCRNSRVGLRSIIRSGAVLERGASVGRDSEVGEGARIGIDVVIVGRGLIGAGAVLHEDVRIVPDEIIAAGQIVEAECRPRADGSWPRRRLVMREGAPPLMSAIPKKTA